jgi:hypothetical protein
MQHETFNETPDNHEAKMAKADLYKLANYSMKLFKMIQEGQELEGWVQAKITKAADYIASVYHYMEYELKSSDYGEHLESAEIYSESVRKAFEQRLTEAKKKNQKVDEISADAARNYKTASRKKYGAFYPDEETAKKREAGKARAQNIINKDDRKKADAAKIRNAADVRTKEPYKPLGGWDPKSGKSYSEGIEDRLAAAREKAAAKGKIKDKESSAQSVKRKVSGKAYGGSKQKDDGKVDESRAKSSLKKTPVKESPDVSALLQLAGVKPLLG